MSKSKFTPAVLITTLGLLAATPALAQGKQHTVNPTVHHSVAHSNSKTHRQGTSAATVLAAAAVFALVVAGASK